MKKILIFLLLFSVVHAESKPYFIDLSIEGYDIHFNKDVHEYSITVDNETNLNINYELSDDNANVIVMGNGNFNKSDNLINIFIEDEEYIIHVYKTQEVASIISKEEVKELTPIKKEIIIFLIISISSILIAFFYYSLFIFN
ncbi:MAG: hypothetical protein J6X02_03155 [Bacilli bacterium]|nr:hypothetical protein [Bacilli bacterium]